MTDFDVVVLGGSFSGTRAALRAAELGGKVCLVEKGAIGLKGFLRRNILFSEDKNQIGKKLREWKDHLKQKKFLRLNILKNLKKN